MAGQYLSVGDEVWLNGRGRTAEVASIDFPEGRRERVDWEAVKHGGSLILITTKEGIKVYANKISRWE